MAESPADQYGALDRLLHRIAFAHPALQRTLGDIENDLFRKRLVPITVTRPVFVTGLPRAGTTLLLELLHESGRFSTFTYRQMPFVLAPLLWQRLTRRSQQQAVAQERAHGDAMTIDYDSPEAFEEVFWMNRLGDRLFDGGAMQPITADQLDETFRRDFRNLACKVVALRDNATDIRYLSKNNANLSRLGAIRSVFPDAELVLCFRHPATHAASLLHQHRRFLTLHDDDAFARRYMAWIGHHDFGANFRPIRFAGRIDAPTDTPAFWWRYWCDAYRHVLDHAPSDARFVGYERLLEDGEGTLARLGDAIGLPAETLAAGRERLRAPTTSDRDVPPIDDALRDEADAVYAELIDRASR